MAKYRIDGSTVEYDAVQYNGQDIPDLVVGGKFKGLAPMNIGDWVVTRGAAGEFAKSFPVPDGDFKSRYKAV